VVKDCLVIAPWLAKIDSNKSCLRQQYNSYIYPAKIEFIMIIARTEDARIIRYKEDSFNVS
jgi:hypothetical protein